MRPSLAPPCDLRLSVSDPVRALAGYPLWIAVTVHNASPNVIASNLPAFPLLDTPPLGVRVLASPSPRVWPAHDRDALDCHAVGFSLPPGQSRRSCVDLSELCPDLAVGKHAVELHLPRGRASGSCTIEVEDPTEAERSAATRLRGLHGFMASLVLDAGEPGVEWAALSLRARRLLAMHAALRTAVWSRHLAEVPLAFFDGFEAPLDAEAAVLGYEVARAGADPSTRARAAQVQGRWPGLEWRLQQVDAGAGRLAALREHVGR